MLMKNKKIYKWIKKAFDTKILYHQIHIFINLFICQCYIFKGKKKYENGEDVTEKCINYFAEATKYFTYGGFSKLLLDKNDNRAPNFDEVDILSKEYKNDLEEQQQQQERDCASAIINKDKNKKNINSKFIYCLCFYYCNILFSSFINW